MIRFSDRLLPPSLLGGKILLVELNSKCIDLLKSEVNRAKL
jgi:hypothetical protein